METRKLYEIASEIRNDWGSKMYFGAKPYVQAMMCLGRVKDKYILDS